MPLVSQTSKYKGYTISKCWKGWQAKDEDGDFLFFAATKSQVRGGISALVNGDKWMIEELRRSGYNKV